MIEKIQPQAQAESRRLRNKRASEKWRVVGSSGWVWVAYRGSE